MKTSTKRLIKKAATTAASIAMALVLTIGFAFAPAAQVSAKAISICANEATNSTSAAVQSYKKSTPIAKNGGARTLLTTQSDTIIDITDGNQTIEIQDNGEFYLGFTTTVAGDYLLSFDGFSAYIVAVNIDTEGAEFKDTEWYNGEYWAHRTRLAFTLAANTQYVFCVSPYAPTYGNHTNPEEITFSMKKAPGEVTQIEIVQPEEKISSYNLLDENDFEYKVSFDDDEPSVFSYSAVCLNGYDINVNVYGELVYFNNDVVMRAVDTPVTAEYHGHESSIVVEILSVTELMRLNGTEVADVDWDWFIVHKDQGDGTGMAWLIQANETGHYRWGEYNDIIVYDKLYKYSPMILDDQNNIVQYDEKNHSWPLIAGRDYAFNLYREFYPDTDSYSFEIYKDTDTIYSDVSSNAWYHEPITYVTGRGLMTGYGGTTSFGTADGIQRQDFLVMLSRFAGADLEWYEYDSEFPDVPRNSYYEAAINWGYEEGIVTGYENGNFGVGDNITREQIVAFLYRYAEYCHADTSVNSSSAVQISGQYSDYNSISDWAEEYVVWAIDKGVINGKNNGQEIAPGGNALRCEIAQIMYNMFKNDIL